MTEAKKEAIIIINKFVRYAPVEFEWEYSVECALLYIDGQLDLMGKLLKKSSAHLLDEAILLSEIRKNIENLR